MCYFIAKGKQIFQNKIILTWFSDGSSIFNF